MGIAGDQDNTYMKLYSVADGQALPADLSRFYSYGPISTDLNRDDDPEVIIATPDGYINVITLDTTGGLFNYRGARQTTLGDSIFVNPVCADVDNDGYADLIFGGKNKIYALDRELNGLLDFPITIDRRYPDARVITSPVVADLDNSGRQDIVVITSVGNCYAFGPELLYGFPLGVGGVGVDRILLDGHDLDTARFRDVTIAGFGSPVLYPRQDGGALGFLAGDGWFYSYDVAYNPDLAQWPMTGGDPAGTYNLPVERLADPPAFTDLLPADQCFNYPNPTESGMTTIRFFLGAAAEVDLKIFDMSGELVYENSMMGQGGLPNELAWNGSSLPSGVYRCIIKADFGGSTRTAFTDVAIVK